MDIRLNRIKIKKERYEDNMSFYIPQKEKFFYWLKNKLFLGEYYRLFCEYQLNDITKIQFIHRNVLE